MSHGSEYVLAHTLALGIRALETLRDALYKYSTTTTTTIIGVCLSVCLSVRTVFVRKISQERVHGSPPNLVGGTRG